MKKRCKTKKYEGGGNISPYASFGTDAISQLSSQLLVDDSTMKPGSKIAYQGATGLASTLAMSPEPISKGIGMALSAAIPLVTGITQKIKAKKQNPLMDESFNPNKPGEILNFGLAENGLPISIPDIDNMVKNIGGKLHKDGGTPIDTNKDGIAEIEAEKNEAMTNDYIFSDKLGYNKKQLLTDSKKDIHKTFADVAKSIEKKYKGKNTQLAKDTKELELNMLKEDNETIRIQKDNLNSSFLPKAQWGKVLNNNNIPYRTTFGNLLDPMSYLIEGLPDNKVYPNNSNKPVINKPVINKPVKTTTISQNSPISVPSNIIVEEFQQWAIDNKYDIGSNKKVNGVVTPDKIWGNKTQAVYDQYKDDYTKWKNEQVEKSMNESWRDTSPQPPISLSAHQAPASIAFPRAITNSNTSNNMPAIMSSNFLNDVLLTNHGTTGRTVAGGYNPNLNLGKEEEKEKSPKSNMTTGDKLQLAAMIPSTLYNMVQGMKKPQKEPTFFNQEKSNVMSKLDKIRFDDSPYRNQMERDVEAAKRSITDNSTSVGVQLANLSNLYANEMASNEKVSMMKNQLDIDRLTKEAAALADFGNQEAQERRLSFTNAQQNQAARQAMMAQAMTDLSNGIARTGMMKNNTDLNKLGLNLMNEMSREFGYGTLEEMLSAIKKGESVLRYTGTPLKPKRVPKRKK